MLVLDIHVKTGSFTEKQLMNDLGVVKFDMEDSLSEKFNLPSSVAICNITENRDRIRLRAKDDFDFKSAKFQSFLKDAHKSCPK